MLAEAADIDKDATVLEREAADSGNTNQVGPVEGNRGAAGGRHADTNGTVAAGVAIINNNSDTA